MTDSIERISSAPISPYHRIEPNNPANEDLHAADAEVASLYYQSTISSMAPPQEHPEKSQAKLIGEQKQSEKSLLGRAKDWLWGIFGWGTQPTENAAFDAAIADEEIEILQEKEVNQFLGAPTLQPPEREERKNLSNAIADLNRDLVCRLKDMAEFEEEMRKSGSAKLDKFIFLKLFHFSIEQKKLKQSTSLMAQQELLDLHKKNKIFQNTHYSIVDAIHSENKARGILKWINISLTAITVGGTAIGFAVGGPSGIFAVGLPLSYLGKGITMLSEGILKYKNDQKTGDLGIVRHQTRVNNENKKEKLNEMQIVDQDVAGLLKKIRQLLDNQAKAERASFSRQ